MIFSHYTLVEIRVKEVMWMCFIVFPFMYTSVFPTKITLVLCMLTKKETLHIIVNLAKRITARQAPNAGAAVSTLTGALNKERESQ